MACTDYADGEIATEALNASTMAVRDAVLCPYQLEMTGPIFAAMVLMGVVNIPIYTRQGSALIPLVITLAVGGVVLTQVSSLAMGLITVALLALFGIGPLLVLRRLQIV